jgi:uncharacterized protein (TIGR02118 family)
VFIVEVRYRTPSNTEAFDKAYFGTHVPLVMRIPGLESFEVSRGTVDAADDVYLVALMRFATADSAAASLGGEEAAASVANVESFAAGLYSVASFETVPAECWPDRD